MKKIKLLMPILGISAIAATAIPLASCGCNPGDQETGEVITYDQFKTLATEIKSELNKTHNIFYPNEITLTETDHDKSTTLTCQARFVSEVWDATNKTREVTIDLDRSSKMNGDINIDAANGIDKIEEIHSDTTKTIKSEKYQDCGTFIRAAITYQKTGEENTYDIKYEFYKTGFVKKDESKNYKTNSTKEYAYSVAPHQVTKYAIDNAKMDIYDELSIYLDKDNECTIEIDASKATKFASVNAIFLDTQKELTESPIKLSGVTIKDQEGSAISGWSYNSTTMKIEGTSAIPAKKCVIKLKLDSSVTPGSFYIRFNEIE